MLDLMPGRLKEFSRDIDAITNKYMDECPNYDTYLDVVLGGIEALITAEKAKQTHPTVISCLDSVIDGLRQARMDYYVSMK